MLILVLRDQHTLYEAQAQAVEAQAVAQGGLLAADLGISRASVPAVLRRAGIVQVAQSATRAVTTADELPKQARRFAGQVRGRVLHILIENEGGQVEKLNYHGAASAGIVAQHLAAGCTVHLVARCASAQQAGPLPAALVEGLSESDKPCASAQQAGPLPAAAPARIRTSAPRPARRRTSAPAPRPAPVEAAPAPGYTPAWLAGQLLLQARLAGQLRGGRVIDRASGELVDVAGAPGWRLLEAITGLKLRGNTKYHLPAPAGYRLAPVETTMGADDEQQVAS